MSNQSVSEDDWISLLLIAVLVLASGAVSLGMFLDPLRTWMVQYHLLEQGDTVALEVVDGVGVRLALHQPVAPLRHYSASFGIPKSSSMLCS